MRIYYMDIVPKANVMENSIKIQLGYILRMT